jgi:hypothetical protein
MNDPVATDRDHKDGDASWRVLLVSLKHVLAAVTSKPIQFHRRWNLQRSAAARSDGIDGWWIGEWESEHNGHHGRLRCIINSKGPSEYEALFHATYARLLRVCYRVQLLGREMSQGVELQGSVDLGILAGGTYSYDGVATSKVFHCGYKCKYDWGTFSLGRPD